MREADLDHDDINQCDMRGKPDTERRLRFCSLCGIDYCDGCKMTHDAQHEFVAEATGEVG